MPGCYRIVGRSACLAAGLLAITAAAAIAQPGRSPDPTPDRYPEGLAVPRSLTPEEAELIRLNPIVAEQSRAAPPGPVRCPAEYDPADAIMMAWEGTASWYNILAQMTRDITTIGNADTYIFVDSTSERSTATSTIANAGADMARVHFVVHTTDTIWIRDYGPRYIYLGTHPDGTGGVRAVVDHTYNRPRPNDDAVPGYFASLRGEQRFVIPLVHGGGNFHLTSGKNEGLGNATRLIVNENPSLTESQIIGYWRDYQNLETTLYTPYPTWVDSTQHIDMWMIMIDDHTAMISQWVDEPTAAWAITSDNAAAALEAQGFTVYRVPAVRSGGTHYTFTNAVICNDLVLIPSYTNSTASVHNATALATWQAACPGKTVRQINSQSIVTSAGVLHCIVMHIPAPSGGRAPSAWMSNFNDAPTLQPGALVDFTWLADDDEAATTADFLLSTDGGNTFPTIMASGLGANDGSYYWTVPDIATTQAVVRVIVHDADGNTGSDDTDALFTINGTGCVADRTADGTLDFFDIADFLEDFAAGDESADIVHDWIFNFFDVAAFLELFSQGCP